MGGATECGRSDDATTRSARPASRCATFAPPEPRLAWASNAWSSRGTPFFFRPFIVLRGVPAARYQGEQAMSAEAELRWQFYERWSALAFGGVGATRTSRRDDELRQNVGSGGFGFRYVLARRFGLNAGIDVARSPVTTAIYFVVGNAWFRP